MSDQINVKDAADAVKGLAEAVPVYNDLLQPAVQELGGSLVTIAKTVRIALAPISAMVWGYEQIAAYVTDRVSQLLSNTPSERIVTPPTVIAGPVLESLRFTGEVAELREMYAKLLASSMDSERAKTVHPAFVEIIRQLSPDEARILAQFDVKAVPVLVVIGVSSTKKKTFRVYDYFSLLPLTAGCAEERCDEYFQNLIRLGLVNTRVKRVRGDYDKLIERIEHHERIIRLKADHPDLTLTFEEDSLTLTRFGLQFVDACVRRLQQ